MGTLVGDFVDGIDVGDWLLVGVSVDRCLVVGENVGENGIGGSPKSESDSVGVNDGNPVGVLVGLAVES